METVKSQQKDLSPTQKALLAIKSLQHRYDTLKAGLSEPIAVIGMGCRFPGGVTSPASYWELLKDGRDAIIEIPPYRWEVDKYFDKDPDANGKMYCRYGGFLGPVDGFDTSFFGISPREAARIDPQHRMLLEVAWEALEHANIPADKIYGSSTGVFIGITAFDYGLYLYGYGEPSLVDAYTGTGSTLGPAAGRLSYILGLTGPSFILDTACSSSLVALHLACQSLRLKECDMALAGGVNLTLRPEGNINFCKARMMAPDGRCKTFDARADGYVRGEGCGIIVLKRLSDVRAGRDQILAIIQGSSVNQDGPSGRLTVPSGVAQQKVIQQALKNASITPDQIDYVEAHGTGTSLGDPIEIAALGAVFGQNRKKPLFTGSVKTNIGHLEAAAGMASVIKVILSMNHEMIPPHLHFQNPNPQIDWERYPIKITAASVPWQKTDSPRRAGISCFGFSGTNAHVIIQEAPTQKKVINKTERKEMEILCLSAKTDQALKDLTNRYVELFSKGSEDEFSAICHTAGIGRSHMPYRLSLVSNSANEAIKLLKRFIAGERQPKFFHGIVKEKSRIAFVFSGEEFIDAATVRNLYEKEPILSSIISSCDEILSLFPELSYRISNQILNPVPYKSSLSADITLFSIGYALAKLWESFGVKPDTVIGTGVAEYAAACIAGIFTLEQALRLVIEKSRLFEKSDLQITNAGIPPSPNIKVFAEILNKVTFHQPVIRMLSTTNPQGSGREIATPSYWINQITQPARIQESFMSIYKDGIRLFANMGPVPSFSDCIDALDFYWLPSLGKDNDGCEKIISSLALSYSRGLKLDWESIYKKTDISKVELPFYPFQRKSCWVEPSTGSGYKGTFATHSSVSMEHPLIGFRIDLPFSNQIRFQTLLAVDQPSHLKDHSLFGKNVMAAADYLVMLLSAIEMSEIPQNFYLKNVLFSSSMVFDQGERLKAQIILDPTSKEETVEYQAKIVSCRLEEGIDWQLNCNSLIKLHSKTDETTKRPDVKEIKSRSTMIFSGTDFYARLEKSGYVWGPAFRWIESLWKNDSEGLALIKRPILPDDPEAYPIYPGLLDACFQLLGSFSDTGIDSTGYIPFSIKRFSLYRSLSSDSLWGYARLTAPFIQGNDSFKGDICWFDDNGLVASAEGFEFRRIMQAINLKSLCYRPEWRFKSFESNDMKGSTLSGNWLIFMDKNGAGSGLTDKLNQIGVKCYKVNAAKNFMQLSATQYELNPSEPEQFKTLFRLLKKEGELSLNGVVHLWSFNHSFSKDTKGDDLEHANVEGVVSVLHLIQARAAEDRKGVWPVWVITRGAQPIIEGAENLVGVMQSPIWGLSMTISLEHPDLRFTTIDLSPVSTPQNDVAFLLREFEHSSTERQIGYRQEKRYVKRLARNLNITGVRKNSIRNNATYLITGGLGDIGLLTAEHLSSLKAGCIVLLGRSEPSSLAVKRIKALQQQGTTVHVKKGDVTDKNSLEKVITEVIDTMPPLAGVIHAAGILDDGILVGQNKERFLKLMAPKTIGTLNLHNVLKGRKLDFLVFFSSISSLIGSPSQGSYSAANAFLDAFAQHLKSIGVPAVSINWGPWESTGMTKGLDQGVIERWHAAGISPLSSITGFTLFDMSLPPGPSQIGAFSIDWSKFTARLSPISDNPYIEDFRLYAGSAAHKSSQLSEILHKTSSAGRSNIIMKHVRQMVTEILNLGTTEYFAQDESFFDLGIDSLMAVELKNRLEIDLGRSLPATIVFDYPTLKDMTGYLTEIFNTMRSSLTKSSKPDEVDKNLLSEVAGVEGELLTQAIDAELQKLLSEEL